MGMKRRGTGRRQVLNLNDKQDSPRRTWQTKYQQICAEHSSQNGDSSESGTGVQGAISSTSSSKADSNNPLSGLVGQYHSDSEAEEEGREAAGKLDAKVSDFLKEIQTIAPAKPQVETPTSQTAGVVHPADTRTHMQPSSAMAWQECYDENSGYIYYWNVETNAVTWEMPPEYQAYVASTTSAQAHHWMMEQPMGMVPVMPAQHQMMAQAAMIPTVATSMASPRTCTASKNKTELRPPGTVVENNVTTAKSNSRKTRKNAASDSEDERIEMITSYGPASEEESEDEEVVMPAKRKKGALSKTKTQSTSKSLGYVSAAYGRQAMGPELPSESQLLMGPQLQALECDVNSQTEEPADSDVVASSGSQLIYNNGEESLLNSDSVTCGTSTLLSNNVPDMGPPGEEMEIHEVQEPRVETADSLKNDQEESGYSAPDSSEDKTVTDETENLTKPNPESDNTVAECESSVANSAASWRVRRLKMEAMESVDELGVQGSGNTSPMPATTEDESDESGETDEGVILSRLRSQARVLKELGGEIPDEIRHLIDQSASEAASPLVVEDVIAQIERELPPDYSSSSDNKEKEKVIADKKKTQGSSSSAEQSPKPTSFALIAGYGDGSDPEEESSVNWQSKKNKTLKTKKSSSAQLDSSSTLFPIIDYDAQAGSSKEKDGKSVASVSSVAVTNDIIEVEDINVNVPSENIPSSSKNSEFVGATFPSMNGDSVTPVSTETMKPQGSSEYVTGGVTGTGLESNLPDSTTNNKAYKRKIRLEIGAIFPSTSVPKPPTSTEQITSAVTTCSEVKTLQPSTTTTTTAASSSSSSTVNYSMWTYYNSDPTSGERRGFGFQPVTSEDTAESFTTDHNTNTSTGKSMSQQKKGIINFVKAETINLPKPEEQLSKNTPTAEDENYVHGEVKAENKEELEAFQHVEHLAHLITEKVKFLGEGKDPVSPVQIMAIQIETLVSAWHAGALSQPYLSNWLGDTGAELARLEQAAAPDGWACEWDRTHKRYFYRNTVTGETQWEYPSQPEEDVCGGGEAMELCTTPPPPPATPPTEEETTPKTPPPPQISQESQPSPPPPPRISSYKEKRSSKHSADKSDSSSSQRRKKRKTDGEVTSTSSDTTKDLGAGVSSNFDPSQPSPSPSNTVSSPTSNPVLPPLPPLPPPPSAPPPPPPPPPPPSELPPLPPTTPPLPSSPPPLPRLENEHGEPLPPGVDPPELPYIVARPHIPPVSTSTTSAYQTLSGMAPPPPPPGAAPYPPLPPPSPPPRPPDSTDLENGISLIPEEQMSLGIPRAVQSQYLMSNAYQASVVSSSSHNAGGAIPIGMAGPAMEYGPMQYVGAMPMPMTTAHIISRPAAKKTKVSLHAELDSFYSDLASLESSGSIPPAMQETSSEQNNSTNFELAPVVGISTGTTPHDISVQPGPSGFYNQTCNASVETEITATVSKPADSAPLDQPRKKKKPKLAPGLALKKKGVSSLVAKWQQVQQEVRRDYKNLDDDDSDSVSSTHK